MSSGGLTEEQRRRIEDNRRKALEKRAALVSQRQQQNAPTRTSSATDRVDGKFALNRTVASSRGERGLFSADNDKSSVPHRQPFLQSGDKSSSNLPSVNHASNSHKKPPSSVGPNLNSQDTSAGSTAFASRTSNTSSSLNSFQSTISKFYRPQHASSSPITKFETKNTSPSISSMPTKTTDTSTSASNRAGPSKSNAANHFKNFKGTSEKPVKGNCVLISRQRFAVVVPYQAQLIGIFKTIPSRSYGMLVFTVL